MKEYMSGDELYRYLHISKRKMKYLLENGYIPMTDTGMKTHRYRIKYEDARAFKRKMKMEPGCLDVYKRQNQGLPLSPPIFQAPDPSA